MKACQLTEEFLQRFYNEDNSYERGESFFCEAGKISANCTNCNCSQMQRCFTSLLPHDGGQVEGYNQEAEECRPQPNPEPHGQVVDLEIFTKMHQNFLEDENRSGAAEHGERLSAEQTEDPAGEQVSEKRLEHSLQPNTWLVRGKQDQDTL